MSATDSNSILSALGDLNPDAILFDNMHSAVIGLGYIAHHEPVAVYSKAKIYAKLFDDGFSREDADEYFCKFTGSWAGKDTPVILDDFLEQ